MRNISINDVDHSPRSVLAIGTDYPPGHVLAAHEHRRAQFLFAVNGAMNVETEDGEWTVLPSNAVMIPAGVAHAVTMDGVSTRSLYIEPSAAPWFPVRCRVVAVSSLLRELLVAAVDMDVELNAEVDFPAHGRGAAVFQLILHELRDLAPLPVELRCRGTRDCGRCARGISQVRRSTTHPRGGPSNSISVNEHCTAC
ncbi:hypothetical protein GCM10020255_086940 [Rhodococcus baikonurensis]